MPTKIYTTEIRIKLTPSQKKRVRDQCLKKSMKLDKNITPTEFCRRVVMKYVKDMEEKENGNKGDESQGNI